MLGILLQGRPGERPGPNGVPGVAYKRAAKWPIDVLQEALLDLCHGCVVDDGFLSVFWIPIGKVTERARIGLWTFLWAIASLGGGPGEPGGARAGV